MALTSPFDYEDPNAPIGSSFFQSPTEQPRELTLGGPDVAQPYSGGTSSPGTTTPTATAPAAGSYWGASPSGGADATTPPASGPAPAPVPQDPRQLAVQQDQVARKLYADLQAAGHDVKWQGDELLVDGRPYVVGGGTPDVRTNMDVGSIPSSGRTNFTSILGDKMGGNTGITGGMDTTLAGPTYDNITRTAAAGAVPGWDPTKVASGHQSPKYAALDNLQGLSAQLQQIPDEAGRKALAEQTLRGMIPELESMGGKVLDVRGEKILFDANDGKGPLWIDTIQDIEGAALPQWIEPNAGQIGPVTGGLDLAVPGAPGAAGVTVGGTAPPPVFGAPGPAAAPGTIPGIPGTTSQPYVPGATPFDDLDQLPGYNALLGDMGTYNFGGFGDLPDMGPGALEDPTEALIQRLLQNPESLDARTIDMLKARNREEQAALFDQEQEDLTGLGYDMGIDDSNWLASEKLTSRRGRDAAVMQGNRNVDIEAARTNQGDRRAAASLAAGYVESKGARKRAERGQIFTERQTGEENLFRSASLKSSNAVAAANAGIAKAAAVRDRVALRESLNQEAARLGVDRDRLLTDWLTHQMDDATQRYGIDIHAALAREGHSIDREKLAQAGREFKEDLAFRIQSLMQQGELGRLNLGLGYGQLQADVNRDEFDRYKWMYGG